MSEEGEKDQQVKFGVSYTKITIIGNMLTRASNNYLSGNIDKWFYNLKGIKQQIISRLKPDEKKEMESKENIIFVMQEIYNKMPNKINKSRLAKFIENYEIRIMELLTKKGYDIPIREDFTNVFGQTDPDQT